MWQSVAGGSSWRFRPIYVLIHSQFGKPHFLKNSDVTVINIKEPYKFKVFLHANELQPIAKLAYSFKIYDVNGPFNRHSMLSLDRNFWT